MPPFGQEDALDNGLPSIFEIQHLRGHALFLNTQCMFPFYFYLPYLVGYTDRMPPQTGDLISDAVYENLLKSNPGHPISNKVIACHFVDAPGGEKMKGDTYWVMLSSYILDNFCLQFSRMK